MSYRFGNFELDESARELRRDGNRVDTEPKAFELLVYLANHRDRAVSKDELQNELWPRTIVTETALSRCVMKARRAVGDDATRQAVIRTLHSHGYRFVAELATDDAGDTVSEDDVALQAPARPAVSVRHPPRIAVAAVAALVIALAVGYFTLRAGPSMANSGALAVLPVHNQVTDEGLSWVRLGLMSLLNRMLEDVGVEVAAESKVVKIFDDADITAPPDTAMLERIQNEADAGAALNTILDKQGGLYRLAAVVTNIEGRRIRRVIVGDSPAALAADMARIVAEIVAAGNAGLPTGQSQVSPDPFINELYARGLDLELRGELEDARSMFRVAARQAPELFWLRYEIALCTRNLREYDQAVPMFAELYDEARSNGDTRALFATVNAMGVTEFYRSDYEAAAKHFDEALEVAADPALIDDRATLHINLALIERRRGDNEKAGMHYEKAQSSYAESGREASPTFNNNYAGLLITLGDLSNAQIYAERAVEGFRTLGQRGFEATSLNRLAFILRRRGDIEGGIARHQQAIAIYRELGNDVGELSVMTAMTGVYRQKGDLTRARVNAKEVKQRAAELTNEQLLADAYIESGMVEFDLGNYSEALREYALGREAYVAMSDAMGIRSVDRITAETMLEIGEVQRASEIAASMFASATDVGDPGIVARAQLLMGKIADAQGNMQQALDLHDAAILYARTNDDETLLINTAGSLAELYLDNDDPQSASALIEEIRDHAAAQHDFVRLDARLLHAQGKNQQALAVMMELRKRAGEAWNADDDALLAAMHVAENPDD